MKSFLKLSRAMTVLLFVALAATLFVRFAPAVYAQAGAVGIVLSIFALDLALAPLAPRRPGFLFANGGLTTLIPIVTQALDIVSREQVGFIPSVNRDANADRLAKNQTLYSWQAPAATLSDVTPGAATPSAGDKTLGNKSISITNYKMSDFYFTGEEEKMLQAANNSYGGVITDMVEQAIRAIVNQMETDLWTAGYVGASRAYGVAGTTPFATNTGESAQMKKLLDDNGAPLGTRALIIDTTAGALLRTLSQLTKVNEAGTDMTLRDGQLLNLNGFMIKESNAVGIPAIGTSNNSGTTDTAGYAKGATVITLAAAGTGTIIAGDIITIAGDTLNKYVVASGIASLAAGGTITLAAPGLRAAIPTSAKTVTVVALSTRNLAFSRNAMLLATRLCAVPTGGDIASDRSIITDARSGISIELAEYKQYRQVRYEISAAWGVSVNKPEHLTVLLG
jgi:hypothetical protein